MFTGFNQEMIAFMLDIRFNNNKEFMHLHKDQYNQLIRQPYYELITALSPVMQSIDHEMEIRPHKCLSRIYRDTRFSKDKSPYRDHHWVAFRQAGVPKEAAPVFWFEARIEEVTWGLGFWGENRMAMEIIKDQMLSNPQKYKRIDQMLSDHQFILSGQSFKRVIFPEQLEEDLKPWYSKKELIIKKSNVDSSVIFKPELVDILSKDFLLLSEMYQTMKQTYELSLIGSERR